MFEYYLNHTQKSMPHFYYRSDKVLHTRCGLRYLFLLNLSHENIFGNRKRA